MTYIFKQTIFILICTHYYCHAYNNFNELKSDMERKVSKITDALQAIYASKCSINVFQCPVKSFNVCEGTDERVCIASFPVNPSCRGKSKYSMTSGIRIPNSVVSFNLSEQMKFFICKTAEPQFQSVLQQLILQNDKRNGWITIASDLGVTRISPGFKYQKQNASATCKNYDPRLRPWYSQSTYGRKKMIIIIQNSKGIYDQPNRFASMQMSLQAILKTSQPQDLFNVIQFSDSPRLFFSQKDMKLVSLSQQIQKFDQANNYLGSFYESVAKNITKSKSILGNYKKALQLALKVFRNSQSMNPEMENIILFLAGFKPTNLTNNYGTKLSNMLTQQQRLLSTNFLFFGFGVNMHDQQGINILNQIACKHDGIFTELNDITYQSMFVDQAESYYDYLIQGNEVQGHRWTSLYEDAFGLGKMVSVIKPCYYHQNNVSKLIANVLMDVLAKQLTAYMSLDEISKKLQVTKLPFKKNISPCVLQNIRKNHRCHKPQLINCTITEICKPKVQPLNQSVIRSAIDTSEDDCCIDDLQNFTGLIIGIVLGAVGAVFLIALAIYCLIFRKRKKDDLQKTYAQIFSQFKDFDQTRIRSDSQISIIKD